MKSKNKYNKEDVSHLDDLTIINYLNDTLSDVERHTVESALMKDNFGADALEGLQQLHYSPEIKNINKNLNSFINRKTFKKKVNQKSTNVFPLWIVLLITILLTISLIGYLIVNQLNK